MTQSLQSAAKHYVAVELGSLHTGNVIADGFTDALYGLVLINAISLAVAYAEMTAYADGVAGIA